MAEQASVWSEQPSAESPAVYAHALRQGGIPADEDVVAAELGLSPPTVRAAIEGLVRLHLLREHAEPGRSWLVPVDPEVATASLISPIDEEVHRRRAMISRIRRHLSVFRPHYQAAGNAGTATTAIEELHGSDEITGQLYLAAERCTRELVAFRPNGWLTTGPGELLIPGGAAMLERGIQVRLLLQHAVRTDIRTKAALDDLIAGGAEIRTTGELSRNVIVFDAEIAFMLQLDQDSGPTGVMIRSASAVQLLLDLVESTWSAAQPYLATEIGYHEVTDHLHRTIIQLLADGLTDEAVGRRLGLSVRTCRRHIATVLRDLDAVSRFQAGVRIGAASRPARTAAAS
jgi:hypothetical protein